MFLRHIEFTSRLIGIHADGGVAIKEAYEPTKPAEKKPTENTERTLNELTQQATTVLESVHRALRSIENNQRAADSEFAQATVELSMLIVERIVRRAIRASDYDVEAIVAQALARVTEHKSITIHLNPADKQLLEQLQTNTENKQAFDELKVQADTSLNRGDCYVDAGKTGMLTTVEHSLTGLRQWLLEGLDDGLTTTDDNSS